MPVSGIASPSPLASIASRLFAEHVEVGVPEAVDRLQLVADDHQLALRPAQGFDQAQLQAVGVLELVDQEVAEPGSVGRPRLGPLEQARGQQLQVLEIDAGAPFLGDREALGEQLQQLADMPVGEAALAGLRNPAQRRLDRLLVGGHRLRLAPGSQRRHLVEARGLSAPSRRVRARSTSSWLALPGFSSASASAAATPACRNAPRDVRLGLLGKLGLGGAAAAQLGVHADRDRPQPTDVESRGRVLAASVAPRQEGFERLVEGLARGSLGLRGVQHPEPGIDADGDRVGREQAVAEAVDRRHPGAAESRQQLARRAPTHPRPGARARRGSAGAARPRPCR